MTLVTSGLIGRDSSASAALQQSLESRLMTRLDTAGSTLFKLTWKRKTTPLGRRYLERQALARRTSGNGFTSVPTPCKANARATTSTYENLNLVEAVQLATVPTPMAGTPATDTYCAAGNNDYSRRIVELAKVPTPTVQTQLAAVTTPSSRDWKDTVGMSVTGVDPDGSVRNRLDQLPRQAQLAAGGQTATGGTGATASTGQLDPAYSRWLMGVPPEWDGFVFMATQSLSRLRKRSSKRTAMLYSEQQVVNG